MFPNEKVCYFDCSRIMFDRIALYEKKEKGKKSNSKDAPEGNLIRSNEGEEVASGQGAYIKYVQNIMDKNNATVENSIYVDIHGSGHRMFGFFEKHFKSVPDCFLLTARFPSYDKAAIICQKYHKLGRFLNIAFETGGGPIEMLNYDLIGTLQNYYLSSTSSDRSSITEPTFIPIALRDALEYKKELILPYHAAMEKLIEKTRVIREDKLNKYKIDELDVIIKKIFEKIGIDRPIISRQFAHLSSHPRTNLMATLTPPTLAPVNSDQTIQKNVEKAKEEVQKEELKEE